MTLSNKGVPPAQMTGQIQKKPHHHGDLRNALIRAGIDILEENGIDALTLRQCAARAGVSHAAPAHHFDGLAGLRAAIAEEGYRLFKNYMLDARVLGEQTPRARLQSICRGYINFAVDNPALFTLIFSFDALHSMQHGLEKDEYAAYQVLRETCAPFVIDGEDPVEIETQVWSLIHGYTVLYLSGRFGEVDRDKRLYGPYEQVIAMLDMLPRTPKT